ncbi:hypothetical protein AB0953_35230 [Streptomyces sp. NPDC046866]|uniref:hypothetical protein n=1 Tax=Streptomyces sp. NPDC046866 TaxID=3154921 RepID=UPI003451D5DE
MTSQLPPRETDHYTQLADATVVIDSGAPGREGEHHRHDRRQSDDVSPRPGSRRQTLAANVCLRELERTRGEEVCRISFRARPTARALRHDLFLALGLPGEPPRHP